MSMQVGSEQAVAFLEDYGLSEREAGDTVRRLDGGGLFAARFTVRGWAHIKRASAGQNTVYGQYEIDGSEPNAQMLYEHTLDNTFEGEHSGQVDAPTGWFAKVRWPWDGQGWYLVAHDEAGNSYILAVGEDFVNQQYDVLLAEYGKWRSSE